MTDLTDHEKVETRRFCGYPVQGNTAAGFSGWRFYQSYGLLEFRINNLAEAELRTLRGFLKTLASLEAAIPRATESLDTARAAVWVRNPEELRDRDHLFNGWCERLCSFLGIPPGPGMKSHAPALIV